MRTTAKILAAAALAVISASSFAIPTNWTGTLTNVKIQYFPDNAGDGSGQAALLLTGTGSSCTWVTTPGAMILSGSSTTMSPDVNAVFAFLTQAKSAGTTVTLTYEPTQANCPIQSVTR